MSLHIAATAVSGKTLFATAQQYVSGSLGDTWNVSTTTWEAVVADADAKISLTEGTGRDVQSYTGAVSTSLGTYTGQVLVRVHDDNAADVVLGAEIVYLSSGVETTIGSVATATVSPVDVARNRTWILSDGGEYSEAPDVIQLTNGTTATLAMSFGRLTNPGTDLTGTPTATVDTVQSGVAPAVSNVALSQDRREVHADFVAATVGKYRIKVTSTSTDGQTFAGYGWLYVN